MGRLALVFVAFGIWLMNEEQKAELMKRVKSRVEMIGDCWIWTQSKTSQGYPNMSFFGKADTVARFVYKAARGTIKHKWCIVSTCGDKCCVAPNHLIQVAKRDMPKRSWDSGARDMEAHKAKSRETAKAKGWAKIDEAKADQIKLAIFEAKERGESNYRVSIAESLGVSRKTVEDIDRGVRWAIKQKAAASVFEFRGAA